MAEYHYRNHDLDYPWTLYFNGQAMPRWANSWSACGLEKRAEELMDEWDSPVNYRNFLDLQNRMDLAHVTESEDAEVFRVCCLALLVLLFHHEATVMQTLSGADASLEANAEAIFLGVREGLFLTHQLSVRDGMAAWHVGYSDELATLTEKIRRFKLPPSDPDWLEQPHVIRKRSMLASRHQFLRCELLALLGTRPMPKELRRLIHGLPKYT